MISGGRIPEEVLHETSEESNPFVLMPMSAGMHGVDNLRLSNQLFPSNGVRWCIRHQTLQQNEFKLVIMMIEKNYKQTPSDETD